MAQVRVKVVIPQQEFYFHYDEDEWQRAIETDAVGYLMDNDLSRLDWQEEVYGPDGKLVVVW